MGLIARALEAAGIATLCMSSAYSITRAVQPPRAVFLDFPLGHTSGRPDQYDEQCAIAAQTLEAFEEIDQSGAIKTLPFNWADDETWKDSVMQVAPNNPSSTADFRLERLATPQYQLESDAEVADEHCTTCFFPSGFVV